MALSVGLNHLKLDHGRRLQRINLCGKAFVLLVDGMEPTEKKLLIGNDTIGVHFPSLIGDHALSFLYLIFYIVRLAPVSSACSHFMPPEAKPLVDVKVPMSLSTFFFRYMPDEK